LEGVFQWIHSGSLIYRPLEILEKKKVADWKAKEKAESRKTLN